MSGEMLRTVGVPEVQRMLSDIDRRCTRERQGIVKAAASATLVKPMRDRAQRSPGRAGPLLARAVSARVGKNGAVVVGPRGGKRGAWFRHFFIEGAKRHQIGGAVEAGTRTFRSTSRQYAAAGGIFARSHGGRSRRFLYNPRGPFLATGPVTHPGFGSNDFVYEGAEAGQAAFIEEVRRRLWVGDWRSGGTRNGA